MLARANKVAGGGFGEKREPGCVRAFTLVTRQINSGDRGNRLRNKTSKNWPGNRRERGERSKLSVRFCYENGDKKCFELVSFFTARSLAAVRRHVRRYICGTWRTEEGNSFVMAGC